MYKKILVFTLITATLLTGCSCSKKTINEDEKTDIYTVNESVLEEKKVGNLEIFNVDMELHENNSMFTIYLKNTSDVTMNIKKINLYFKDKNGNLLLNGPKEAYYYDSIEPDETKVFMIFVEKNLSDAVSVDYELAD